MEHREAIEYDLLTRTGFQIDDIGRSLSWDALDSFLQNVDMGSATIRSAFPEYAMWSDTFRTNILLAEIYDTLQIINANINAIGSGKPAKRPKPYPRPGKDPNKDKKHYGRGALPANQLHQWIEERRAAHARGSTSHDNGHTGHGRRSAEDH